MLRGKRLIAAGAAALVLAYLLGPGLGGCFTPPLILPGGEQHADPRRLLYPTDSEAVSIEVEPGVFLRGLFVPADDGAPIVVHLLESAGSFTPCTIGRSAGGISVALRVDGRTVAWELADLGLASLFVDYRGVGPSDGERDPRHLARDAEAIYDEALRRASGDESRLLLRGTSIGSLAAAHLLDIGRHPAAVVMIAPVRDETVVSHYARAYHNAATSFFLAPWFTRGVGVDLDRSLRDAAGAVLVITTPHDELLPFDEQDLLRQALAREGATFVSIAQDDPALGRQTYSLSDETLELPGDHFWLARSARKLLIDERRLLGALYPAPVDADRRAEALLAHLPPDLAAEFPRGSRAYEALRAIVATRLNDDPLLSVTLVLAECRTEEAIAYLDTSRRSADTRGLPPDYWLSGRNRDDVRRRLDLSDPDGRVPVSVVVDMAGQVDLTQGGELFGSVTWTLDDVLAFVRGAARPAEHGRFANRTLPTEMGEFRMWVGLESAWRVLTVEHSVAEPDACRLVLRAILKGAGIDERVVAGDDGRRRLEVRDGERWRELDPLLILEADGD